MKQQMERVEADLNKSKQVREKQTREFTRQLEHERLQHEREVTEIRLGLEQDKAQILKDVHLNKELVHSEHEKEMENLRESHRLEASELETRFGNRQERDGKKISQFEQRIHDLREEVAQSNQLRKQQLVELGLLREEEKQKMQRDFESGMVRTRSESEQQKLGLQKDHSAEMENMLGKTNDRLKDIEKEYSERDQRTTETVSELQATITYLRDEIKRVQKVGDSKAGELSGKHDDDRKSIKRQYAANLTSLQKELETQHNGARSIRRQMQKQEADHEEKVTHVKLSYEERMRGLMSASVRQELEDTIESLRSQVSTLQQKTMLLQEDVDQKHKFLLTSFGALTSSPIKST
jgi:centrosomal protein CEP112